MDQEKVEIINKEYDTAHPVYVDTNVVRRCETVVFGTDFSPTMT